MNRQNPVVAASLPPLGVGRPKGQKGAVLIFALIVLLVMTVLAISGVGNSTLEQRMAGNYSQSMTALQAAEETLRIAEQWLETKRTSDTTFNNLEASDWWFKQTGTKDGLYTSMYTHDDKAKVCGGGGCEFDPRDETQWCSDGSDSNCKLLKGFTTLSDSPDSPASLHGTSLSSVGEDLNRDGTIDTVARPPRFIIEYVGPLSERARVLNLGGPPRPKPSRHAFRVTVIAWGQDASARHVLQSHVVLSPTKVATAPTP